MFKSKIIFAILSAIGLIYIIAMATKVDTSIDGKKNETCSSGKSKYLAESVRGGCFETCVNEFLLLVPKYWSGWKGKEIINGDGKTCADFGYTIYNQTLIKGNIFMKVYLDRYDKPAQ